MRWAMRGILGYNILNMNFSFKSTYNCEQLTCILCAINNKRLAVKIFLMSQNGLNLHETKENSGFSFK